MSGRSDKYLAALLAVAAFCVCTALYGWRNFEAYQYQHQLERNAVIEGERDGETAKLREVIALKAEQDMAEWTYSLLWIGIIGLATSVVGIWFVFGNLLEMRRQTANQQSVGENQVRAFVHAPSAILFVSAAGKGLFGFANRPHLVSVEIRNSGHTPAFAIGARAKLYVTSPDDRIDELDLQLDQENKIDAVAKDETRSILFVLGSDKYVTRSIPYNAFSSDLMENPDPDIPPNAFSVFFDSKKVVCTGRVRYRDIFGDEFESEFEFSHFGVPSEGDKPMLPEAKGLKLFHKVKARDLL